MKNFLLKIQVAYHIAMLRYETWLDARANARALNHIVNKSKTEWIFSGTVRNENGVIHGFRAS